MGIQRIFSNLRNRKSKNDVDMQVQNLKDTLGEVVSAYDAAEGLLKELKLTNVFLGKLKKSMSRHFSDTRGTMFDVVHSIVKKQKANIAVIEKVLNNDAGSFDILQDLTYKQLQGYQLLDNMEFVAEYSMHLLIFTIGAEIDVSRETKSGAKLTPYQIKFLEEHGDSFVHMLKSLSVNDKQLERAFDDIPHMAATEEDVDKHMAIVTKQRIDPRNTMASGFIFQVIYPVREMLDDWRENKRQKAINERNLIEFMIQDLKDAKEGNNDPVVQKQIEYYENRLIIINDKIKRMET